MFTRSKKRHSRAQKLNRIGFVFISIDRDSRATTGLVKPLLTRPRLTRELAEFNKWTLISLQTNTIFVKLFKFNLKILILNLNKLKT